MFEKKNILIGLSGLIITILLLTFIMGSGVFANDLEAISFGLGMSLILFFAGFIIGGYYLGIPLGLYMAALFIIMEAPGSIKGPLCILFIGSLFLGSKLLGFIRKKKTKEEPEETEEEIQAIFEHAVFLIQPNKFKTDITYKVVGREDFIYFCKCGSQFYDIDPDIAVNENMTEEELLLHKKSFRIEKNKIKSVEIHTKKRLWTGNDFNNGSVYLNTEEKFEFIIHILNDFPQVEAFFKKVLNCPVTVLMDPERKRAEEMDSAYQNQSGKAKGRIKTITEILNILGIFSGLWLIFFPKPIRLAVCVSLLIPILGLLCYIFCGTSISFDERKNNPHPVIVYAFLAPAIALSLVGLVAFNICYDLKLWGLVIAADVIISIAVLFIRKEYQQKKSLFIILPIYIFAFAFGAVTTTNCLFDTQAPQLYFVSVLDKSNTSRSNTIVIKDWHPEKDRPVSIHVSNSMYDAVEIGQLALVHSYPGLWNIEWFQFHT